MNEDTAIVRLNMLYRNNSESAGNDGTIKFNVSGASPVTAAKTKWKVDNFNISASHKKCLLYIGFTSFDHS